MPVTPDATIVGVAPDMTYSLWERVLKDTGSPAHAEAREGYDAVIRHRVSPAFALAIFGRESTFGTNPNAVVVGRDTKSPGNCRTPVVGDWPIVQVPGKGGYVKYPTWADGWADMAGRLVAPSYVYAQEGRRTIRQIVERFAPSEDDNDVGAYVAYVVDRMNVWGANPQPTDPPPEEPTPMPDKPIIMLVAGHRNLSGGNPEEASMTPFLARDTLAVLRRLGYETYWWQQVDGDADPDDTQGGLDKVASGINQWAARQASDNLVMLDLHYEGSPARGVFAIIPDKTGLTTGAPVPQHPNDTWEGNPLDRKLGRAIAQRISERTGLPLRQGIREPGLMDESQTGVGGDGFRLGMFAWTSPQQPKMVRLIIEHGSHTQAADRTIIFQPDFSDKCAAAIGQAMQDVFGSGEVPPSPPPSPPPPPPAPTGPPKHPIAGPIRTQFVGTVLFVALNEGGAVEKTLSRATAPREWADMASPSFPLLAAGTKVRLAYACIGKDASVWFVMEDGARIPADAFVAT